MNPDPPGEPGTVLLDTIRPDGENRRSLLFRRPAQVLEAHALPDVLDVLDEADRAVRAGYHLAGLFQYEAGYAFEPATSASVADVRTSGLPLVWLGVYEAPDVLGEGEVDALLAPYADLPFEVTDVRFALGRAAYREKIAAIKAHIHAGDVYQINFTAPVHFRYSGPALALYRALRQRQRVAYGAYLRVGGTGVLSLSPELFFRRDGRRIWTRPMKGTARRGRTGEEDRALRRGLETDAKGRAENLMIVDLLRNDLSVVCEAGSVRVPDLFTVEPYETLHQMTSTVEGRLRAGVGYRALFRALFPCGSVTGAPKIRAMQLIEKLEGGPRGVYCGAIGHVAPGEEAAFSVAIRTAVLEGGRGAMGTGSGVVWDSDADAEYDECLLKARFLTDVQATRPEAPEPFKIIETMRWEGGAIPLLDLHLDRMRTSARHFNYPFDESALRNRLRDALGELATDVPHRVRVTLDRAGAFELATTALTDVQPGPWRVMVSDVQARPGDPFFHHKTTRRSAYDEAYRQAQAAGCDEALLVGAQGEVTEGSRTNVWARRGDALYTPPLAHGLLDGVYRRHLFQTRTDVRERVLYPDDLRRADALYLSNAVMGLVPATLVEEAVPPSTRG